MFLFVSSVLLPIVLQIESFLNLITEALDSEIMMCGVPEMILDTLAISKVSE